MANQYDVFRTANGRTVVVLQSDLIHHLGTRAVAALVPKAEAGDGMWSLNPVIYFGDAAFVLAPQYLATLSLPELGERIGSLDHMRGEIIRAMDALLSGI